jgi:sugar phosphate isomerase/epimerase
MVLGSPLQRNLLPGVTHDQAMELAADCLRRAMPAMADCGVTLAVEPLGPMDGDFLTTARQGVQLCEMVASPHCRLHLDCKAMSSEAKPIPQLLRENRGLLEHFHANDPNLRGPGMGKLDFVPIFQALAEIDYRGWVSVEVFDYTPGVEALASESIRYMRECLAKTAGR